jgi:hypothetical protein
MASDDPENWERAWREYFDPLQRRFPDHSYQEDIRRFRDQLEQHRLHQQAKRLAGVGRPVSEAQWFYLRGLRLCQQGEGTLAVREWENLIRSFRGVESEAACVRLAEEQLAAPIEKPARDRWGPVHAALDRARQLRDEGKRAEADAIWSALEALYRDDPSAAGVLNRIREDRGT